MMSHRSLRLPPLGLPLVILSLAIVPVLLPLRSAHAQMSLGGGPGGPGSGPGGGGEAGEAAEDEAKSSANAPPPALPGAVSSDPAAPSSHAALDMDPTAALFDAIDRGDLTAAKDALGRGADLSGTNVLGEKPIEMSIDLNRNDITFLLLSMRNTDSGSSEQVAESASARSDKAGHVAINARSARNHGAVEQASYTPSQLAADGGAPKPRIGFLGFGGS